LILVLTSIFILFFLFFLFFFCRSHFFAYEGEWKKRKGGVTCLPASRATLCNEPASKTFINNTPRRTLPPSMFITSVSNPRC
jgi:hypothetical protein